MSTIVEPRADADINYPESDGQPVAENTLQFQWITMIEGGLEALFVNDPNVFVAGDLLWYPVEGDPTISAAPDAMVVFGRPKGFRGSYLQWRENNIAPQVVFEVISPGNRPQELLHKNHFYQQYGVEEYYAYNPHNGELSGWHRVEGGWEVIPRLAGWTSPRLGVRFEFENGELAIYRPDGRRFTTFAETTRQLQVAEDEAKDAKERARRLAAQLRALGVEPELEP